MIEVFKATVALISAHRQLYLQQEGRSNWPDTAFNLLLWACLYIKSQIHNSISVERVAGKSHWGRAAAHGADTHSPATVHILGLISKENSSLPPNHFTPPQRRANRVRSSVFSTGSGRNTFPLPLLWPSCSINKSHKGNKCHVESLPISSFRSSQNQRQTCYKVFLSLCQCIGTLCVPLTVTEHSLLLLSLLLGTSSTWHIQQFLFPQEQEGMQHYFTLHW